MDALKKCYCRLEGVILSVYRKLWKGETFQDHIHSHVHIMYYEYELCFIRDYSGTSDKGPSKDTLLDSFPIA